MSASFTQYWREKEKIVCILRLYTLLWYLLKIVRTRWGRSTPSYPHGARCFQLSRFHPEKRMCQRETFPEDSARTGKTLLKKTLGTSAGSGKLLPPAPALEKFPRNQFAAKSPCAYTPAHIQIDMRFCSCYVLVILKKQTPIRKIKKAAD